MNDTAETHTPSRITRREPLLLGASAYAAAAAGPARAAAPGSWAKDSGSGAMRRFDALHAGRGSVNLKRFPFDGHPAPAHVITYDISPGASEGVHVHHLDDRNKEGAFDAYDYIVSRQGQMEGDGKIVPVAAGDHVHTPLEGSHGVENTHPQENLKVFLTFINRAPGA